MVTCHHCCPRGSIRHYWTLVHYHYLYDGCSLYTVGLQYWMVGILRSNYGYERNKRAARGWELIHSQKHHQGKRIYSYNCPRYNNDPKLRASNGKRGYTNPNSSIIRLKTPADAVPIPPFINTPSRFPTPENHVANTPVEYERIFLENPDPHEHSNVRDPFPLILKRVIISTIQVHNIVT